VKKFIVSESAIQRVRARAEKLPLLNNSIRQGEGSLVAYIGEEVVKNVLKGEIQDTYDYDIVYQNTTVDVKTKERTVAPKPYYECSVADFNTKQDCDEYAFVSVLDTLKEAWYLGKISKPDFYTKAVFHRKGEVDPANNFTFKADCYNIPISLLSL
jgi:hypothetical protein